MADPDGEKKAVDLAAEAVKLAKSYKPVEASQAIRAAIKLAPNNVQVKAAIQRMNEDESSHPLSLLCRRFARDGDQDAGFQALGHLNSPTGLLPAIALECMKIIWPVRLYFNPKIPDGILAGLLRKSLSARTELAIRLQNETKTLLVFNEVLEFGNLSSDAMCAVLLDFDAWQSEDVRIRTVQDVLRLYLTQLIDESNEREEKAMRGIAMLLAVDAIEMDACHFLDQEWFDSIVSALDYRNSAELRTQATMAIKSILNAPEDPKISQERLTHFVKTRISRGDNQDLILVFSAAAVVFSVETSIAVHQFLSGNFVSSLVPLLKTRTVSEYVEEAALEMLSAACIDSACREEIRKHCLNWLQGILSTRQGRFPGLAAVALARLNASLADLSNSEAMNVDNLVLQFKNMMFDGSKVSRQNSIEGLAFLSVRPKVKELIVNDKRFLNKIIEVLTKLDAGSFTIFGGLTLLDHLTRFLRQVSEEEAKVAQLQAYANASKRSMQPDPFDSDDAVSRRCQIMLEAGTIPVLVRHSSHLSPGMIALLFNILLSMSRPQGTRQRGIIAQQGGAKIIVKNYYSLKEDNAQSEKSRRTAAQALSRILIAVNPSLVFPVSGDPPMFSGIRPLITLLTDDPYAEGPRDHLPKYEALMALTNFAGDPSAADAIVRNCFPVVEELLIHHHPRVQLAATQLLCNLMRVYSAVKFFDEETAGASRRMHIILALSNGEEADLRVCVSSVLASLCGFEGAVNTIMARDRGMEAIVRLCGDSFEEVVHRGAVCVRGIASIDSENGRRAKARLKQLGVVECLHSFVRAARSGDAKQSAIEAVRELG